MNEDKIQQLMLDYRDSLGSSRRPTPRLNRSRRLALSGSLAVGLLTGVFLLWPKDAAAAALERVSRAIRNAKTMDMTYDMIGRKGPREMSRTLYKNGAWRLETRKGSALECVFIAANGKLFANYTKLDHTTLEPMVSDAYRDYVGDQLDALDFAKEQLDVGLVGTERKTTLLSSKDGKTYTIQMERPNDHYFAEILVDKATDLPISASLTLDYTGEVSRTYKYLQTYRFNLDLPDSLFEQRSSKPVVVLKSAQWQLERDWKKPLGTIEDTEVRDARVTRDGTIWIACTPSNGAAVAGEKGGAAQEPKWLLPSSVDAGPGSWYARTQEMVPSSILGKPQTFKIDGKNLYIVAFPAMSLTKELPGSVKIKMSQRQIQLPGFSAPEDKSEVEDKRILTVPLVRDLGALPSYVPALDLDHFGFQIPFVIQDARAAALEKDGNWLDAARAHEQSAEARNAFIANLGWKSLDESARCYEEAGMPGEAERVRQESNRLKNLRKGT